MLSRDRQRIDEIDEQIVSLLEERYDCVSHIAQIKKENHLPIFDTTREEMVLEKIRGKVSNSDYTDAIVETFNQIMKVSKDYQKSKQ